MKLIGEDMAVEEETGGNVVIVGVKFDAPSKELLTWALVKVAKPGDQVIALHALDNITESSASLISLVKTFDSMMAAYEGFCNLKQVDLKLKVCRGASVKKIIVNEAKHCGAAATVILGTSQTHHRIRSNYSVAKYCAKKLDKDFTVMAVNNGKILFRRETIVCQDKSSRKKLVPIAIKGLKAPKSTEKSYKDASSHVYKTGLDGETKKTCPQNSNILLLENSSGDDSVDDSLALVPVHTTLIPVHTSKNDRDSRSIVIAQSSKSRSRWSFLRRVLYPETKRTKPPSHWVLSVTGGRSTSAVYPDQKQSYSDLAKDSCSSLDGESGAIVPLDIRATCLPLSPVNGELNLPKELQGLHERYSSTCRLFSYQELSSATCNFMTENMVGRGGSSYVYRGCLPDGKELAVKVLKSTAQVLKEFVLEIEIVTTLHHQNLISLYGFCFEDNHLLLVYEFLSRGSLEENLYYGNKKEPNAFGWSERYRVAVGVAEALEYLHSGCDRSVIHRDVKSSNILLSDDFEPQLSDFGLASWASEASLQRTSSDVAGTFGYLAPEYFMHGKVSHKIDVYAFGVVLLELISGRKPIDRKYPKGQESLVMWAKQILKDGKSSQLLDSSLSTDYDVDEIEQMVLAATLCIRQAPSRRPHSSYVLKLLQGDAEVLNWAREQVSAELVGVDDVDGEVFPTNMQSHLNLALLDLDDDSLSVSSPRECVSVQDYLDGRCSRSTSFD